ncbi:MAG TPA: glycoside hydrolase family 28 protein, partial [Chitinophagaceae bacterium]|nr:glycoside hydrolase family 28 protein [Chitinophagaceae bacterium]
MKSLLRNNFIAFFLFIVVIPAVAQQKIQKEIHEYVSKAPFEMKAPELPVIPKYKVNIKDFGAVGDGETLNTEAIDKAIEDCSQKGGGTVVIPAGLWLTGPIELKSNINLHVNQGAVVLFSRDHSLYPIIRTSSSSHTWFVKNPIYGYNLENIAITGEGIFNGSGDTWRPVKKSKRSQKQWKRLLKSGGVVSDDGKLWWPSKEGLNGKEQYKKIKKEKGKDAEASDFLPVRDYLRPYMVSIVDSRNILIDGPTFMNAPMFALKPRGCHNLVIRNVKINNEWYAQNGDGIDLSACTNAIVYDCTVNAGDDGIAMKSSRSSSDQTDTACLKNIIIADCIVYRGHGGFVIGSNTDGGMENIFVNNCSFINTDIGIRVKSGEGKGGKVHDIYIEDIYMANIKKSAILFSTYYEDKGTNSNLSKKDLSHLDIPEFSHFYMNHIYCNGAKEALSMRGLPQVPIHHIRFSNVNINADQGISA